MAADGYMLCTPPNQVPFRMPSSQTISPMSQPNLFDPDTVIPNLPIGSERSHGRAEPEAMSAILMRKLPQHISNEALRTMFLFAKDFVSADFIPSEPEDKGYLSAIARFRTSAAAQEARSLLDGKQNTANEAPMIVETLRLSPGTMGPRRKTFDLTANRNAPGSSASTASSSGLVARQSSRFNGPFQAMDRLSSPSGAMGLPSGGPMAGVDRPTGPDARSPYQNFFPPQSPIGTALGGQRVSGKDVIEEYGMEDDAGELLKDPVAFAKNETSLPNGPVPRRATNPQLPTSRFGGLTLSTGAVTAPPMQGFAAARSVAPLQSPTSTLSPGAIGNLGPNPTYQLANQHYQRHNYPPVNPADQNPPCNTLYVGNLPIDTSEDELKAMFSKQRGYKRLCFRTKQNGPMCFVEFEDISFATKALNDLYGHPLHNSVKGGIRLSFSKNPLGVRTGQPGGMGSSSPMSPQGPVPGVNGIGSMQSFSTANGPPPGLTAPPGLNPIGTNGASITVGSPIGGNMMTGGFGAGGSSMSAVTSPGVTMAAGGTAGSSWAAPGAPFADHIFGR
jgi:hypothetical protein